MFKNALLIAEKPSLMREIQKVFKAHASEYDFNITFMAQAGHLFTLKLPKEVDEEKYKHWVLDHFPEIYPYQYKSGKGKTDLISSIKKELHSGKYDAVIHAGDPDAEGQLLVDETLILLKNTLPVYRFWSNDLTEGAIVKALHSLRDNKDYKPISDSALIRQHADYQFGMNATGVASIKVRWNGSCPLGRVKAPILRLLVDREIAIQNYVEKITYKPAFKYKDCEFVYPEAFDKKEEVEVNPPKKNEAQISEVDVKKKNTKPPKLYKLSTLQTDCSKFFHWDGQKTLQTLQGLYEKRIVSYPRTDCEYISPDVEIGSIKDAILKTCDVDKSLLVRSEKDVKEDKNFCNKKAIETEGHTGIIPTGSMGSMNDDERALFDVICRRFLAMFGDVKVTKTTKISAMCDNYDKPYEFSHTQDLSAGFEIILNPNYELKPECPISVEKGEIIKPIEFYAKECKSTPPKRYTDGTLIAALDKPEAFVTETEDGSEEKIAYKIGTPATRATIIDQLVNRDEYLKKKGQSFEALPKAILVVNKFREIPLFDVKESGMWEMMLDKVRKGEAAKDDTEEFFINRMKESVDKMKQSSQEPMQGMESLGKCPNCGGNVVIGKFGAYCLNKCGITLGKAYGKELTKTELKSILAGKKTLIKNIKSKNKPGKVYDAYLTPVGTETYTYNGKEGISIKYEMEFPKTKK